MYAVFTSVPSFENEAVSCGLIFYINGIEGPLTPSGTKGVRVTGLMGNTADNF